MKYDYYWNNVPGIGKCRNNLIYTSLISEDKKTFVQWFYNDSEYHQGQNEVVDPEKMESKWLREINYLTQMRNNFPDLVPKLLDVDFDDRKIYLEIDGLDFWNRANCDIEHYNTVASDWQDQMLTIIKAHKTLGLYKYSMHPSSYFIVNGKLKSINYFFTYEKTEGPISIADHASHIYSGRQSEMKKYLAQLGISWDNPYPLPLMETLCWNSFRTNYPEDFIDKVLSITEN